MQRSISADGRSGHVFSHTPVHPSVLLLLAVDRPQEEERAGGQKDLVRFVVQVGRFHGFAILEPFNLRLWPPFCLAIQRYWFVFRDRCVRGVFGNPRRPVLCCNKSYPLGRLLFSGSIMATIQWFYRTDYNFSTILFPHIFPIFFSIEEQKMRFYIEERKKSIFNFGNAIIFFFLNGTSESARQIYLVGRQTENWSRDSASRLTLALKQWESFRLQSH